MKLSELIAKSIDLAQEGYDNQTWVDYFNDCLDDLTPVAKMLTTSTIPLTSGVENFAIPANVYEPVAVYVATDGNPAAKKGRIHYGDGYSVGWKMNSDYIILQPAPTFTTIGNMTLHHYKKLTHLNVNNLEDVSDLPEQYHNLLVIYAAGKAQQKEEELNDKNDFYQEYLKRKAEMAMDRTWIMEPHNRKFIKQARLMAQLGIPQQG